MPSPQRVPLTKACDPCIKSKRKCNRGLPRCQRCTKLDLPCWYKNAPMMTTLGRSFAPKTTAVISTRGQPQKDPSLTSDSTSPTVPCSNHYSYESSVSGSSPLVISVLEAASLSLSGMRLGPPDVVMTWDGPTMAYLTNHLRSFTRMFARGGGTPFIHPELYRSGFPHQLHNIFTLCCSHAEANQDKHLIVSQTISSAANTLVNSISSVHAFISILELLQSLILLQIITLLYPVTRQILCSQAESRMPLLASLTKKLFRSVPAYLPASISPYQAWILGESVRRTIHVAHMVQGVYSVMSRGHFVLTAFVEALPLNQKSMIWDCDALDAQSCGLLDEGCDNARLETDLISYRELVDKWDIGAVKQPRLFEEMLIVACKGASCVLENQNQAIY